MQQSHLSGEDFCTSFPNMSMNVRLRVHCSCDPNRSLIEYSEIIHDSPGICSVLSWYDAAGKRAAEPGLVSETAVFFAFRNFYGNSRLKKSLSGRKALLPGASWY